MKYPVLFLFFACTLQAQNKVFWDTTRCQKFKSNLIIGIFQSYRNFENEFSQGINKDEKGVSKTRFAAESRLTTGIEISYDKFSFGFAIKSTPQKNSGGKGNTQPWDEEQKQGSLDEYLVKIALPQAVHETQDILQGFAKQKNRLCLHL